MADYWGWKPYVSVAERRRKAAREMEKRKKQGQAVSPVIIEGRAIVKTFWGKAWCDNLERYSDFANRLPRGRTYVRNGSVIDLQIARRHDSRSGQRLGDLQSRGEGHSGDQGALEIHLCATARARLIRWSSFSRDGFPRA